MADSAGKTDSPAPSLLSDSAKGASFLILLQVSSRFLTFAVNQVLLRYLSPELLAISTQLELYQISVLYFARESLRIALQRQGDAPLQPSKGKKDNGNGDAAGKITHGTVDAVKSGSLPFAIDADSPGGKTQTVVNLSYVPSVLGVPLAYVLALLYLRTQAAQPLVLATPWLHDSVSLYGIAAILELLTEPCFVVVQQKMLYKMRAAAESSATVSRCLITCGVAVQAARRGTDVGVLPFALGQMSYAVVLAAVYYWHVSTVALHGGFSLFLRRLTSQTPSNMLLGYLSRPLLSLGSTLFLQSAVKHVLTQGDTFLIGALSSLQDQGVYALASNYGGLIARMLFQPIEESCRNLFAQLLAASPPAVAAATSVLRAIVRLYLLLSIVAAALGPTIAPLLLRAVAGPRWAASGAGAVLSTYCYYIPVLALNGVTEAFIASVASPAELRAQSGAMVGFSAAFAASGFVFLRLLGWGAHGLVWANVANMLLRIAWSARFIAAYLDRQHGAWSWPAVLPSAGSLAAGVATAGLLQALQRSFTGRIMDLLMSAAVAGPFVLLL